MKAITYTEFGGPEVLRLEEVDEPHAGRGQVRLKVVAAGVNPLDSKIRNGGRPQVTPPFPVIPGVEAAGVVDEVGEGVTGVAVGDEVLGFTHDRASHAEYVAVNDVSLTHRPAGLSWDVAGSLYVAGTTAYATVFAGDPQPGDTVVVSGAAGGVGSLAVQLARLRDATVIGLASERNHAWLREQGVVPVEYGDGVAERIRAASGGRVDAFIDTFGDGYVELAVELGVRPDRINTIKAWEAAATVGARTYGEGTAACAVVSVSWPGWPRAVSSRCRSPPSTRWSRCRTRSASWSAGTPTARSCCAPWETRPSCGPGARAATPGSPRGPWASS